MEEEEVKKVRDADKGTRTLIWGPSFDIITFNCTSITNCSCILPSGTSDDTSYDVHVARPLSPHWRLQRELLHSMYHAGDRTKFYMQQTIISCHCVCHLPSRCPPPHLHQVFRSYLRPIIEITHTFDLLFRHSETTGSISQNASRICEHHITM